MIAVFFIVAQVRRKTHAKFVRE